MNSNSDSSTVRPPTSALLDRMASRSLLRLMPCARSRFGSTTTLYCFTNPPTPATSATPSAREAPNRMTQSCSDRSSASVRSFATTTYW